MARMLNKYETCDGTTIIYAPHKDQIIEVLIDTEDLEKVKSISKYWKARRDVDRYYIYTWDKGMISLHRLIMNTPKELVVDHINHNPSDNRKSNLRNVTQYENMQNIRRENLTKKKAKSHKKIKCMQVVDSQEELEKLDKAIRKLGYKDRADWYRDCKRQAIRQAKGEGK